MFRKSIILAFFLVAAHAHAQLLPVQLNGQWGAIDTTGQIVLPATYQFLSDADQYGYLMATQNGKSGLLDSKGRVIVPLEYDRAKAFSKDVICVWYRGQCGLRRPNGETMADFAYDRIVPWEGFFRTFHNGKTGLLAKDGTQLLPAEYNAIETPSERAAFTYIYKGAKKGAINAQGQLIAPAQFDSLRMEMQWLVGYQGQGVSVFSISQDGSVSSKKEYRTQPLWQMAKEQAIMEQKAAFLRTEPNAKKPRWQKNGFDWKLANAVGESLIGDITFFRIGIDETSGKSYAMNAISDQETEIWYIDHLKAEVLFKIKAEDIYIQDFNQSKWARITIDSLRDGLVNQKGEIKKVLSVNGSDKRITDIGAFNQGVAPVRIGNRWGVINGEAQWVAEPIYDQLDEYSNQGLAIARKDGKFGALDMRGREAIPFEYDGIGPQEFGVFRVKKGKGSSGVWGVINAQNREIVPFEYSHIFPFADNREATVIKYDKLGVINTSGKELMKPTIEADFMKPFEQGIALVGTDPYIKTYPNGEKEILYKKMGYVKRDGTLATRLDYDYIANFKKIWEEKKGVTRVIIDKKIGYIDHEGTIIISPAFDEIEGFEQVWDQGAGLALIKKDGYYGFVDHKGSVVLKPRYAEIDIESFSKIFTKKKGIAKAKKGKLWGYMNYKEKEIIPFEYGYISDFSPDSIVYAKGYDRWGLLNQNGDTIMPFVFDKIRFLPNSNQQIFQVLKSGTFYQKLNEDGEVVESSESDDLVAEAKKTTQNEGKKKGKYEYLTEFNTHGLAIIRRKDLLGLANEAGKTIVKPQFLEIGRYSEGMIWFRDADTRKYGYLDKQGNVAIPAQFGAAGDFHDGLAPAGPSKAKWGFINNKGVMVIPPKFREITAFSGGYAIVDGNQIIDERGKKVGEITTDAKIIQGFINDRAILQSLTGKFHITPYGNFAYLGKFDDVTPFYGDVAFVKRGEEWDLIRFTTQLGQERKDREVINSKVRMSLKEKRIYLAKYGKDRIIKTRYGQMTQDMEWKKVSEGVWRMIGKDGALINETIYESVMPIEQPDGSYVFLVKASNKFELFDSKGQRMTDKEFETVRMLPSGVIKAEAEGKTYYLSTSGRVIWPQP